MCSGRRCFLLQKILFDKSDILKTVIKFLLISLFCFITVTILLCITALVISRINFSYEILTPIVAAVLALTAVFDGFLISRWFKENGLIWGVLSGLIIILLLLIFSLKYNTFEISSQLITKSLVTITAGAIGGIIGVNTN